MLNLNGRQNPAANNLPVCLSPVQNGSCCPLGLLMYQIHHEGPALTHTLSYNKAEKQKLTLPAFILILRGKNAALKIVI